jgi:hypothetical protein
MDQSQGSRILSREREICVIKKARAAHSHARPLPPVADTYFGRITLLITCTTPFDASTSAAATWPVRPFSSVI